MVKYNVKVDIGKKLTCDKEQMILMNCKVCKK